MLDYDRINVSEGIDTNKTDGSCEFIICHCCYFLKVNFRFQPKVCNDCDGMTQKSMNFYDFAIVTIGRNNYSILF